MTRQLTCILCPNGCDIEVDLSADGKIIGLSGMLCPRGKAYAIEELTAPLRTIASSIAVAHGELPLVSVRLDKPVPKERIMDVMIEIRKTTATAPVAIGDILIPDVLGLHSDVIATKNVGRI